MVKSKELKRLREVIKKAERSDDTFFTNCCMNHNNKNGNTNNNNNIIIHSESATVIPSSSSSSNKNSKGKNKKTTTTTNRNGGGSSKQIPSMDHINSILATARLPDVTTTIPEDLILEFYTATTCCSTTPGSTSRSLTNHQKQQHQLPISILQQCLHIFTKNMKLFYEQSSWGYDMDTKRTEFIHPKARFLIVRKRKEQVQLQQQHQQQNDTSQQEIQSDHESTKINKVDNSIIDETREHNTTIHDSDKKDLEKNHSTSMNNIDNDKDMDDDVIAFVHYRYCLDDDESPTCVVLYVYEIQVLESYQRQKQYQLGTKLMLLVEDSIQYHNQPQSTTIGSSSSSIQKIMLTVFKHNTIALQFYLQNPKLLYTIDQTSPSQHNDPSVDYEILSKNI